MSIARPMFMLAQHRDCPAAAQFTAVARRLKVVPSQDKRPGALLIQTAVFDALRYQTVLQLKGASSPVEIQL